MQIVCSACGAESPEGFRFCPSCGAALTTVPAPKEMRKVVTVVFCDLTGSTALGDRTDPEALRQTMRGYYEQMRAILERHGGTVEKFVGDAVMAVFGIPVSYEDDALRAVRAAWEMRTAVAELGLQARIGVNTGEVVAGEGDTLVTGDAVNVAARLEQGAEPGDVLIGRETQNLVRGAAQTKAVELVAKGKPEPVRAFRLLDVDPAADAFARRLDSPLVGRQRERERLRSDFERVVSERTSHVFTLLGPAGVGKSRLVLDFVESADARVLRARCLPYGEGITYWPLVEVVLQLDADPEAVLGTSPAETQLAFRRLLEREAAERPLVVVFDDLHWAEETFLDLVEHVADWSREAPIFLLCVARPELLDLRPAWGGGKMNATSILLEPLPRGDVETLVENLLDGTELGAKQKEKILTAAGGNPLFVEEMIAMVREEGDGTVAVPPTIQALLQARLDRLGDDERSVIERGAVEGEVFHRTAVVELAPEQVRPEVAQRLLSLVRKQLIRPSEATLPDDEAFRFRHLLIRDAAYDALPKATRADLHERFARWLDEHVNLVEQDEIVGYHLEQAASYRRELGTEDHELASAAAVNLVRASRAAAGRGDVAAADNLARRAVSLLPEGDPQRLDVLPYLVLTSIDRALFAEAEAAMFELEAADDVRARAYALVLRGETEMSRGELADLGAVRARADEASRTFSATGDDRGLAYADNVRGHILWMECRAEAAQEAFGRALEHAERAGEAALVDEMTAQMGACAVFGPTPVAEAIAEAERMIRDAGGKPLVEAGAKRGLARLLALVGDFERARTLIAESSATMLEAGLETYGVRGEQVSGFVERIAGNDEAAVEILREGAEELRRLGDHRYFSTTALNLVLSLLELGRIDEAEEWLEEAIAETNPADVVDASVSEAARGRIATLRGDPARGIEHAERAVELAERTDFYDVRASAHVQHGKVLTLADRRNEARAAYERALAITRAKGAMAWTKQIEQLLAGS